MSYLCWVGEKPEHTSELECAITLADKLEKLNDQFFMFVNFHIGRQIDLAILKKDAIIIVELKSVGRSRVLTRLNGPWQCIGEKGTFSLPGGRNPFSQIREQYYCFHNWLEDNKEKFLSDQKASFTFFKDMKKCIAIAPYLNRDPHSESDPNVEVIGFDRLHKCLDSVSSEGINLQESEILALVKILNLTPWKDIHDLVSPMTGPEDYDWERYCKNLSRDLEEKLKSHILLRTWTLEPLSEKARHQRPFKEVIKLIDLQEFILNNDRIIVLGGPGSGKSACPARSGEDGGRASGLEDDPRSPCAPRLVGLEALVDRTQEPCHDPGGR